MIRPLRRAHRVLFVLLTPALLGVVAAAYAARRSPATMSPLPAALVPPGEARTQDAAHASGVLERLPEDWNEPDALVYWADEARLEGGLPEGAQLVGSARAGSPLPRAPDGRGTLVYSLAHGRVVLWRAGGVD